MWSDEAETRCPGSPLLLLPPASSPGSSTPTRYLFQLKPACQPATQSSLTKQRCGGGRRHGLADPDERLVAILKQEHALRNGSEE